MLTAVSVARDCGMIAPHERVIIAAAAPPRDTQPTRISWQYTDDCEQLTHKDSQVGDKPQHAVCQSPHVPHERSSAPSTSQPVDMSLEEHACGEQPRQRFHFAMSGRSFAVITEYFPDLLQKVLPPPNTLELCSWEKINAR